MSEIAPRLDALAAARPPGVPGFFAAARDVVVIACSSRGGSSVFAEMLRRSASLVHFRAEINPFLALAGLTWPTSGTGSDALGAVHAVGPARDRLEREMAADAGRPALPAELDLDAFAADLCWRLTVQWPREVFELPAIRTEARAALAEGGGLTDLQRFHAAFLSRVRATHPSVNPWFYDLAPDLLAGAFPGLGPPVGPPSPTVIEEPPFVAVGPWTPATADDLALRPLVVKTPSNAYRLDFLRALFPRARFRVLHLVRHPAASVNGLVDGWRFHGFHAHRMERPLAIRGYADVRPADACWWKYDLPPGWEEWKDAPIEQVAAFQWRSAHDHVLDWLDARPVDRFLLRFEDVVGEGRRRAFGELFEWLGVPLDEGVRAAIEGGLPPVMATAPPRQRRWFEKAALIGPVLADPRVRRTAERLGYGDPAADR